MAKGIIVVDIPEQCDVCIAYYQGLGHDICGITEEKVDWDEKPDWCPLKALPKKQVRDYPEYDKYITGYDDGWDACIDEILGDKIGVNK